MFDFKRALASVLETHPDDALRPLYTPWGEALDPDKVLPEYPRPQMRRDSYVNLNGWWEYAIRATQDGLYKVPESLESMPQTFDGRILVPFSPESLLSGVKRQVMPHETLWYKREVSCNVLQDKHVLLHFEAVDYACSCFVNGTLVGIHHGAYAPFCFDITDALEIDVFDDAFDEERSISFELVLAVKDPSEYGCQPRGKQRLERGTIWCSAQSGIMQTVWIEVVSPVYLDGFHMNANPDKGALIVKGHVRNTLPNEASGSLTLHLCLPQEDAYAPDAQQIRLGTCIAEVHVPPKEVQDFKMVLSVEDVHLWSPEDPYLYDVVVVLDYEESCNSEQGEQERIKSGTDEVQSYCAFRTITTEFVDSFSDAKISTQNKRKIICLNHQPYFLQGILDQGYWPDGLLTAPSEEALLFDIELAKRFGFNMIRKHIKTENARWYYLCDKLGMLVWQDMVNGGSREYSAFYTSHLPTIFPWIANHLDDTHKQYRFGVENALTKELWIDNTIEMMDHLSKFSCIIGWTVFNEAWGQFDARKMTELMRLIDDTRLFDQTSGWCDQHGGDLVSEHNYFRDVEVPSPRFVGDTRAPFISEFGGYAYYVPEHTCALRAYGYAVMESQDDYQREVSRILETIRNLESEGLAGFVYTQLTDVEEEVNGLVTYDRRIVKFRG